VIYGTGAGVWNQSPADGQIITNVLDPPFYIPSAQVSLTIGGQPATLLYAGAAPGQVSGLLQINAVVPIGIASGAEPVVLTIGSSNNAQQGVTVAVQ
jgi:trimeric autotransporter adhesin